MESFAQVKQKVRDIVLDILPTITDEELEDDKNLFNLGLDSITAMTLVLNLQETFGIAFDASEISFENFQTLANITELLSKKVCVPL
ncbi:MAG TPA: acyl carrier protein [Waterburya sp.]|jgi:acyl carrier protein